MAHSRSVDLRRSQGARSAREEREREFVGAAELRGVSREGGLDGTTRLRPACGGLVHRGAVGYH